MAFSKVYKYELAEQVTVIAMPANATIMHVDFQITTRVAVAMWVLVDPDAPNENRTFRLVNTGEEIPYTNDRLHFIDTIVTPDGASTVLHVFEITSPSKP